MQASAQTLQAELDQYKICIASSVLDYDNVMPVLLTIEALGVAGGAVYRLRVLKVIQSVECRDLSANLDVKSVLELSGALPQASDSHHRHSSYRFVGTHSFCHILGYVTIHEQDQVGKDGKI